VLLKQKPALSPGKVNRVDFSKKFGIIERIRRGLIDNEQPLDYNLF
jgi:hypothetical protein